MNGSTIIFYLLAAMTIGCGIIAVSTRQIFRAAIALLFSLVGIAGIYFWMDYEFIAAVQIVVYVGGIVVLIIFSIFLTQQSGEKLPIQKMGRKIFSLLAVFCGFALTIVQIFEHTFTKTTAPAVGPTIRNIGEELISLDKNGYALPFEVVSILLLAALIGCIVIAMRTPPETPKEEVEVKRKNGIKVILPKEEEVLIVQEETGGIQ
ncbi:MAG TPA: NADH-quinone oxidoreductase subunit J [Flavisolibacter sp.]|jgi:NADH-quinone oxidoreductase subunit J|nr:NADH-quinone oxidoreductase subunit J [Flavisolibacter sp.]